MGMDQAAITRYITTTFSGVDAQVGSQETGAPEIAWGDTFFIYDPGRDMEGAGRFPFATIVTKDYGEFDNASDLDRPGVFRLNIGLSEATYERLVGAGAEHDFTALDRLMPHPVYGKMYWVSVLSPSAETFDGVKPMLAEAYDISAKRWLKPQPADES